MPEIVKLAENVTLYCGECEDVLPTLAPVSAVVTDPPYGIGFMGKRWDHAVPGAPIWAAVLRALLPGGHLLAFAGTRTQHRMACAIEDVGFEIRDLIAWVYGEGFPKSHDVGRKMRKAGYSGAAPDWDGFGTALKPSFEPITLARRPFKGPVFRNVLEHGTGALNIDAARIGRDHRDVSGWSKSGSVESENRSMSGKNYARDPRPDAPARWPANLVHDGSPEAVKVFPDGSSRFFYCAKPSMAEREFGCENIEARAQQSSGARTYNDRCGNCGRKFIGPPEKICQCPAGEKITDKTAYLNRNNHPTVKPVDLMQYLVRLVTPPGAVVLDPYLGSGTTGIAAVQQGFGFVGIEREPEYFRIAVARVEKALQQGVLGI